MHGLHAFICLLYLEVYLVCWVGFSSLVLILSRILVERIYYLLFTYIYLYDISACLMRFSSWEQAP